MPTTAGTETRDAVALCARLFETELSERSDLQLADDLRDLQQLRNLIDGELLRRLGAFDARGGAAAEHVLSTQSWLRGVLHLSPSAAGGHVAVARRLRDGGPLALAAACGDVSYEHAVVINRAVSAVPEQQRHEAEAILTDTARFVHPSDLRIAGDRIREAVAPESLVLDEQSAREGRYLNVSRTIDGKVSVEGILDPESGSHWLAAAHAFATPLGPEDNRSGQQRRADALTEVIVAGLAAGTLPETGGEKPHVALTLDVTPLITCPHCRRGVSETSQTFAPPESAHPPSTLAPPNQPAHPLIPHQPPARPLHMQRPLAQHDPAPDPTAPPATRGWCSRGGADLSVARVRVAHLADGTTLVGPVLDALLCDVSVHRVITAGPSQVLDVGRLTRLWPAAVRRAAAQMYQGCGAHGCDRPIAFTDLHHVVHWQHGGATSLDNAVPLCRAHHRLVHEGGWVCAKLGRLWIAVPASHPLAQPPPDSSAA
ncbi:MAG: hypothetical protein QOF57_1522 [Frankiaceae bacterium]|nr:hypothetical protein [Frankiaceae bacterium]